MENLRDISFWWGHLFLHWTSRFHKTKILVVFFSKKFISVKKLFLLLISFFKNPTQHSRFQCFPSWQLNCKKRHYENWNFQQWLSRFWVSAAYFLPKVPSELTRVWSNKVSVLWQKNLLRYTLTRQGIAVSLKLLSRGSSAGWKSFNQNFIILHLPCL